MALRFCPLFSGSDGNCCFLEIDDKRYLIDAGFSGKKIENNLKNLGVDPSSIDLIFLTHEHIDHIRGAGVLSRRFNIKICANIETFTAGKEKLGKLKDENIVLLETNKRHKFSKFDLETLELSHDCKRGLGFVFDTDYGKVSAITDTGIVTDTMIEKMFDSKIFYFEANHDVDMLIKGPYEYSLKMRILSDVGHISNKVSAKTLSKVVTDKCKKIYLGHLSQTNNKKEIAYDEVSNALEFERVLKYANLEVANRFENSSLTEIKWWI